MVDGINAMPTWSFCLVFFLLTYKTKRDETETMPNLKKLKNEEEL